MKTSITLTPEERKTIELYGKQVAKSFVDRNIPKKEQIALVGMALQAFEDGLIFNRKMNTKK